MRTCPFPDCERPLPDNLFACKEHWFMLSREQRDTIYDSYKSYLRGVLDLEGLRGIQERIVNEVSAGGQPS